MQETKVTVYSAFTILNAIPSWRGIAVGLELPVRVTVRLSDKYNFVADDPEYVKFLVSKFEEEFKVKSPVEITVRSDIPPRSGLKSSSAVAVAVICGLALAHGLLDIRLSACLHYAAKWSREYGVSITGALDDAAACLLGGIVYTDNLQGLVLRQDSVSELRLRSDRVLVLMPRETCKPDRTSILKLRLLSKLYEHLFYKAVSSKASLLDIAQLNTLLVGSVLGYDLKLLRKIQVLTSGLPLISGNGPAIVVLNYDEDVVKKRLSELESISSFIVQVKVRDVCFRVSDPVSVLVSS